MADMWDDVPEREILPGVFGRFIHSDRMTFAMWRFEKGATIPLHHHPHEQVAHVLEGEFEFFIDGKRVLLTPGMVGAIPSNVPHQGKALTPVRVMDVFSPVREDYRDGTGSVLTEAAKKS